MCPSFLWSGPALTSSKAKVAWEVVCKPKQEGGLGLRSLKEANDVGCLKLIWKIVSHGSSLWVKWVDTYLLKQESFWAVKANTSLGSWIWKKLLKYRDVAKQLCKVEANNGQKVFFWYDNWSTKGCLMDVLGPRGVIDLGIGQNKTVAEARATRRRRHHRVGILNQIEEELIVNNESEDVVLWRGKSDSFRNRFSTKDTWNHIRTSSNKVVWQRAVWFTHATPKFSFCIWLAAQDRLATGDRMLMWNAGVSPTCILCHADVESCNHLFFSCGFASEVWEDLAKNIYNSQYTTDWQMLINYISDNQLDQVQRFLVKYVFQVTVYTIWRERNRRKHGENPSSSHQLVRWIDKQIRNQLAAIKMIGDTRFAEGLQQWFASRM